MGFFELGAGRLVCAALSMRLDGGQRTSVRMRENLEGLFELGSSISYKMGYFEIGASIQC